MDVRLKGWEKSGMVRFFSKFGQILVRLLGKNVQIVSQMWIYALFMRIIINSQCIIITYHPKSMISTTNVFQRGV